VLLATRRGRIPGSRESKNAFGKGFLDAVIVGSEVAIMFLNGCHFIAKPDRDLVDAFARRNQKTRECVPHCVGSNPITFLLAHVISERGAKVIAVKPFSVRDVRSKHEWRAESVGCQKLLKCNRKGNRALFAVFEIHGGCFAQMETAVLQIEPEWPCFDNFLETKTGVEAAEEDKSQFVGGGVLNETVAKIEAAKIFARSANRSGEFHVLDRIAAGDSSGVDSPSEECTDRHDISEGGCVGCALERFVVKALNLPCCNSARGGTLGAASWQTREACCAW